MHSQQITCLHGQCDDPSCGFHFVYVGRQRVPVDVIIRNIETGASNYWTVVGGKTASVVVAIDPVTAMPVITTQAESASD